MWFEKILQVNHFYGKDLFPVAKRWRLLTSFTTSSGSFAHPIFFVFAELSHHGNSPHMSFQGIYGTKPPPLPWR